MNFSREAPTPSREKTKRIMGIWEANWASSTPLPPAIPSPRSHYLCLFFLLFFIHTVRLLLSSPPFLPSLSLSVTSVTPRKAAARRETMRKLVSGLFFGKRSNLGHAPGTTASSSPHSTTPSARSRCRSSRGCDGTHRRTHLARLFSFFERGSTGGGEGVKGLLGQGTQT